MVTEYTSSAMDQIPSHINPAQMFVVSSLFTTLLRFSFSIGDPDCTLSVCRETSQKLTWSHKNIIDFENSILNIWTKHVIAPEQTSSVFLIPTLHQLRHLVTTVLAFPHKIIYYHLEHKETGDRRLIHYFISYFDEPIGVFHRGGEL